MVTMTDITDDRRANDVPQRRRRAARNQQADLLAPMGKPSTSGPVITEPDLVDRIWEYVLEQLPELCSRRASIIDAIRSEYGGDEHYIRRMDESPAERAERMRVEVRKMWNGRNASEVARVLRISRATVYRVLKQPGE